MGEPLAIIENVMLLLEQPLPSIAVTLVFPEGKAVLLNTLVVEVPSEFVQMYIYPLPKPPLEVMFAMPVLPEQLVGVTLPLNTIATLLVGSAIVITVLAAHP